MLRGIAAFLIGFTLMLGVLGTKHALGKDNNPFSGAVSMKITMTRDHSKHRPVKRYKRPKEEFSVGPKDSS